MKTKVMEVITFKKQTSKTKCIIEAALAYRPPLNISRNFFSEKKKKSRGFYSREYGNWGNRRKQMNMKNFTITICPLNHSFSFWVNETICSCQIFFVLNKQLYT